MCFSILKKILKIWDRYGRFFYNKIWSINYENILIFSCHGGHRPQFCQTENGSRTFSVWFYLIRR